MNTIQPRSDLAFEQAQKEVNDRKIKREIIDKIRKLIVSNRIKLRNVIIDWLDYIHLHFVIKQNPYFTTLGIDKLYNIDDVVLTQIKDNLTNAEYKQDKLNELHQGLQTYKKYDDRFKGQSDKIFNDKFNGLDPSLDINPIRLEIFKIVAETWLNQINTLLSQYEQLSAKDLQTIITEILASPIYRQIATAETNNMLNDIESEFSSKLAKMVLSDPGSELRGRRADEQQNMLGFAFLRANREWQQSPHLHNKRLLLSDTRKNTFGGRQYKRRSKSTANKRRRRRRTSRK